MTGLVLVLAVDGDGGTVAFTAVLVDDRESMLDAEDSAESETEGFMGRLAGDEMRSSSLPTFWRFGGLSAGAASRCSPDGERDLFFDSAVGISRGEEATIGVRDSVERAGRGRVGCEHKRGACETA